MVERIREILTGRQLTPTQFADSIGVARPIVSHILSGRNKPSLEVVQKIITAFPDLSIPWLLSGTGAMLAAASDPAALAPVPSVAAERAKASNKAAVARPVAPEVPEVQRAAPTLSSPPEITSQQVATVFQGPAVALPSEPNPAAVYTPVKAAVADTVVTRPPAQDALPLPSAVSVAQQPVAKADKEAETMAKAFAEPGKTIRRIVIFYHDGTFSDFQPEKSEL